MRRTAFRCLTLAAMLLGLPALGVMVTGNDLGRYLEFPPTSRFIPKASFSWVAFAAFLAPFLLTALALFRICLTAMAQPQPIPSVRRFPWWGWAAVLLLAFFWLLSWSRFDWMASLQEHTFFPLWVCYTVTVNALTCRRTGRSLLTHDTAYFLLLFPASAAFWWFFEYLNRFVQNWHYTGVEYSPLKYFLLASLCFSTVLPAVLSTAQCLASFSWIGPAFGFDLPPHIARPRLVAWTALLAAAAGLCLIGVFPDYLFPLLWVSPLVILLSLQAVFREPHLLQLYRPENRRQVVAAMLAALICGFFWEMWNFGSLIRWTYDIPFVNRFHLFEMPILGYAGYLPFGLECLVIANGVQAVCPRSTGRSPYFA